MADITLRSGPPSQKKILQAIGETIKIRRKQRCLSEKKLAERCLLSRSTIQLIEKGDPNVKMGSYMDVMVELCMSWCLAKLAIDSEEMRQLLSYNRVK